MLFRTVLVSSLALCAISPALAQTAGAEISLEAIDIRGDSRSSTAPIESRGYVTSSTRSATKTDTPLLETPQSVSTVTRDQIDQRQPQTLNEALGYTPGVSLNNYGFDPRYDAFVIRGIDATYTGVFRDGLRQVNSPNGLFRLEPYGVEAITILRGPAASIYGASSTGGIVDLVSKRPTDTPLREIELQTGSFGRLQGAVDFSGPLNADRTLLYRITALARDAGTEIGAVKDNRIFIAPALTWRPSEATSLTLLGEYLDATTGGTAAYVNTYAPYTDRTGVTSFQSYGATKTFLGDAEYNDFHQRQGRIGTAFEHRFNDSVILRQNVRYSTLSTNQEYASSGYPGLVRETNNGVVADTNLETRLRTGPVDHVILTGIDVSRLSYRSKNGFGALPVLEDPDLANRSRQTQTLVGIYAQDQLKWGGWRATGGLRHDWLSSDFRSGTTTTGLTRYQDSDRRLTGRAALGYVFANGIAPYVSYGTSFTPNPGTVLNGGVAEPTSGRQVEAGVKYDIPGTNASLRAAVFDLRQDDAIVYQVVAGVNQQTQLDLRVRGFEIEGVTTLDNGLSLQASYSYNDAEITRLTPATDGNGLTGVPYHTASIWADYTVQSGWARGVGIGGGVRYVGSSFGDNYNRAVLENGARVFADASLRYDLEALNPRLKGAQVQVSGSNLFDTTNQVCTSGYCYFDAGRKVIASLRYRW